MATTNNYYKIKHGLEAPSQDAIQVTESTRPTIRPTLNLNFAQAKVLDPRITFTRASTATYYGTRTALAEQNLLTYSQEFDNAYWFKGFVTIDANSTIAPDGTLTADRVTEQATSSVHYINTASNIVSYVSGTAYTYSLYVKKGTGATAPNIIQLSLNSAAFASPQYANFDISVGGATSGTITTSSNGTAFITTIGDGWYRCSWTATATSSVLGNSNGIFLCNNNPTSGRIPTYAGAITSDVFVWGAQLESRSTATAYTPTTTQPITNYIPVLETAASNVARFDHNPVTFESLGLLIEQQSTNLLTYSEQFDNAVWSKANVTVVSNQIIAPDGTLTADLFYPTTSGSFRDVGRSNTASSAVYTVSIYAKYSGIQFAYFRNFAGSNLGAHFDLLNGTVGTVQAGFTSSIQNVGNGIYRCTMTSTAAVTNPAVYFGVSDANNSSSVTASGTNGIYIWGAQLEAAAFATSYIPTVASQVTRAADSASMTGTNFSSWYAQGEGTIYSDAKCNGNSGINFVGLFANVINDSSNYIDVLRYQPTLKAFVVASGASQVSFDTGLTSATAHKAAFAYKTNDFAVSADGATVLTDTVGIVPSVDRLYIGSVGSQYFLNGTIKKLSYYPLRLSNTNLQALTS